MTATLTRMDLNLSRNGSEIEFTVAEGIVDCLVCFLKAARDYRSIPDNPTKADAPSDLVIVQRVAPFLPEPEALVDRCISLISEASMAGNSVEADKLIYGTFSVILEASLLSPDCWSAFKNTGMVPWLLKKLFLEQPKDSNRQVTVKIVKNICRPPSGYQNNLLL